LMCLGVSFILISRLRLPLWQSTLFHCEFLLTCSLFRELGSSVSILSGCRLDDQQLRFDCWQRQRIFPITSVSRPALGPTQPSVQCVPGVLSQGLKHGRGMTLTTHPHLVLGREWVGAILPLPPSMYGV
jgi:hypothetical protein